MKESELLLFSVALEGVYRAVGHELNDADHHALRAIGVDFSRPLQSAYPVEVWREMMVYLARRLWPELSLDDGIAELGRRFVAGYEKTVLGKAALVLARIIGPRRALDRVARQFRNANNYSVVKLTEVGPRHFVLWCNQVGHPGWYRGILDAGLKYAGASGVEVTLVSRDPDPELGATFDIRWQG